jgi:hypothetical protein
MISKYFLLIVLLAILPIACNNDNNSNRDSVVEPEPEPEPEPKKYYYEDFAHFDTTVYFFLKESDDNPDGEKVMNREWSFGEPFTDVNGNGVYDWDIDIFIMSEDPETNQDLDRNSSYTPPGISYYCPGMRFDDIDGDGQFDGDPHDSRTYSKRKPFCDYNNNGVHDSEEEMKYGYDLAKCSAMVDMNNNIYYRLSKYRNVFSFTSDSGITYTFWPDYDIFWSGFAAPFSLIFSDSGLVFSILHEFVLHVLDTGVIDTSLKEATLFWQSSMTPGFLMDRTMSYNHSLDIDGTTFSNLLLVKFDNAFSIRFEYYTGGLFEFYFSRHIGLIAIRYKLHGSDEFTEYYFATRHKSLPIPMTRIAWDR